MREADGSELGARRCSWAGAPERGSNRAKQDLEDGTGGARSTPWGWRARGLGGHPSAGVRRGPAMRGCAYRSSCVSMKATIASMYLCGMGPPTMIAVMWFRPGSTTF